MNSKRGFIVPLVIVIIAVLAIGGGIYIYTKNKSTSAHVITNPQTTSTTQVAGSKTYSNSKYGFQFSYPREFLPDEQDDTIFGMVLQSKDSSGFISILFGKNDNVKITDALHPFTSQAEVVSNKGLENIDGNLWNKFNFDSIPQEGRGTAGSQLTYYVAKGNSTLVVQCTDCSEETFGDMASSTRVAFNQILSSFTFNTSAQSNNSDWKAYTNSQLGFSIKYPPVGDAQDQGTDSNGNHRFIIGLQSNSSSNLRLLSIEVGPSANCTDTTSGADPIHKTINGTDFIVYDLDRVLSGSQPPYVTAREYCAIKNGNEYKIITQISYTGTPVQIENDTTINQALNSFTFTKTSRITSGEAVELVSNLPEVKQYMKLFSGPNNTSPTTGDKAAISIVSKTSDGYVVWVFEDIPDSKDSPGHAVTFARYDVNTSTGKVTKE